MEVKGGAEALEAAGPDSTVSWLLCLRQKTSKPFVSLSVK